MMKLSIYRRRASSPGNGSKGAGCQALAASGGGRRFECDASGLREGAWRPCTAIASHTEQLPSRAHDERNIVWKADAVGLEEPRNARGRPKATSTSADQRPPHYGYWHKG